MITITRTLLVAVLTVFFIFTSFSQNSKLKNKKYPSLLWEITGKGMAKPSYLFGTMHVSSKMVFHLSDSFYIGLKNADVVALETNPGNWQEDFSRYDLEGNFYNYAYGGKSNAPNDYLSINTVKAFPYEKLMEKALYSSPSIINSFLYRTNSETSSDFEEDTYLDLYIYQVGKKWNKKVCGVENFDESMTLMKEAYADAAKDKNIRERSYDIDNDFSYGKLEEAYRTGNLDLLDTINKVNSTSAAFDEKFLYKRNEIQAASIDSILKAKVSLFAGVGAAHLPGERGVIEMLRRMGYKMRPIKMTERDSRHKDEIETIRVPVQFTQQTSDDGFFSVNLPGKLYSFTRSFGLMKQQQYADMSNGSYYMISRIYTNAALWGHSTEIVNRKIDSVLYENIPGKILSKQAITKNGYKGFDILNRTRRGDYQRYNIFITPFEVILFKVSGNGEYVKLGKEASQFFNSVQLKEYKTEWKKYGPRFGGFEVEMPHQPIINNAGNWQFMAYDKAAATNFEIIRTDIHNIKFAEEDSFDLNLLEESFGSSEFIEKQISRKHVKQNGYAALETKYKYKDGSVGLVKFIIQGPHYYTLVANAASENSKMIQFLNSFSIKPFVYGEAQKQIDTSLFFSASSPVAIQREKKLDMYPQDIYRYGAMNDDDSFFEENGTYKDKIIVNDSTGEKIYVSFYKPSRYSFDEDTVATTDSTHFKTDEQNWTIRSKKKYELANKMKVKEYELGDAKSSRIIRGKSFSKDGLTYHITVQGDTLTQWSSFITSFFTTFIPVGTAKGINPVEKRSALFFADFFSTDTMLHKRAAKNIHMLKADSSDFLQLKKAIQSLTWKEKKYLDVKNSFIYKLGSVPTKPAADYLKHIYYAAGDTVDLQYTALEALLQQETTYSYQVFRDIMVDEPPVLDINPANTGSYKAPAVFKLDKYKEDENYSNGNFIDDLKDSLLLTKSIFKDLLPLININDYEQSVMNLLETMVDSNMITAKDYELYLPKFLIEAKQEMKKQVISEKNKSIEKAQADPNWRRNNYDGEEKDYGNNKLSSYATLLMPFWEMNPSVSQLFQQMLRSNDKRLKYNTAILLLRHKRPIPDTLLKHFAAQDEFRYELYTDLKEIKQPHLFPVAYNDHIDLAKSKLLNLNSYETPDTIAFIDKLPLHYKNRSGFVYFFKYRQKKDDNGWKIATAGLIPSHLGVYEFEKKSTVKEEYEYNFTELTTTKIDEEEPLKDQLQKVLKKMVYTKRKSGVQFYDEENKYSQFSSFFNFRD
jgi:uncharacterized protein YbaP (TraB family)